MDISKLRDVHTYSLDALSTNVEMDIKSVLKTLTPGLLPAIMNFE